MMSFYILVPTMASRWKISLIWGYLQTQPYFELGLGKRWLQRMLTDSNHSQVFLEQEHFKASHQEF